MVTSTDIANLVDEVLWHLTDETEPVSEHDLLADLAQEEAFRKLNAGSAIRKQSQQHFLMMHALYRLRERFEDSEFRLQMRPDAIRLVDLNDSALADNLEGEQEVEQTVAAEDDTLRDYYLDVTQLMLTGCSGAPLDDHKRHHDKVRRHDLYATLGVNWGADWEEVKSAYRQKAIENHPDNGGDVEQFKRLRYAYYELKRLMCH